MASLILHVLFLLCALWIQNADSVKCRTLQSCDECLNNRRCGWCGEEGEPSYGSCVRARRNSCPRARLELYSQYQLSPDCSGNGVFRCGQCECNPHAYGRYCECFSGPTTCQSSQDAPVCSNRGTCICGECACNTGAVGQYCECDNLSCDYSDGQICGGPDRGVCRCGECRCNPGYSGPACDCPTSVDTCMASNEIICNGRGSCVCGRCECDSYSFYRGQTCEDCPTCPGKCERLKPCVQCKAFLSGSLSQEECDDCPQIRMVDQLQIGPDQRLCQFADEDGCVFYFAYDYNTPDVLVQTTMDCPAPSGK